MADFTSALGISASGMRAQASRLRFVSENIANTDTPGFRRKTVSFHTSNDAAQPGAVELGAMRLDRSPLERLYDPSNPMADASGYYDGSNVNLLIEVADAREASRSYEANLKMFDQLRQMSGALLDLLKR